LVHAERAAASAVEQVAAEKDKLVAAAAAATLSCQQALDDSSALEASTRQAIQEVQREGKASALRLEAFLEERCDGLSTELLGVLGRTVDEAKVSQQEAWTKELDEARADVWRIDQESGKLMDFMGGLSEHAKELNETVRGFEDLVSSQVSEVREQLGAAAGALDEKLESSLSELRDGELVEMRTRLEASFGERLAATRAELAEVARVSAEVAAAEAAAQREQSAELERGLEQARRRAEDLKQAASEELRAAADDLRRNLADGLATGRAEGDASRAALREALAEDRAAAERRAGELERRAGEQVRELGAQVSTRIAQETEGLRADLARRHSALEERLAAAERAQGAAQVAWRAAVEEAQGTSRRGLEEQRQVVQELSRQSAAGVQRLEELVAEVVATLREEVAAAAVSSFQGEMRLWKGMVTQMKGAGGGGELRRG